MEDGDEEEAADDDREHEPCGLPLLAGQTLAAPLVQPFFALAWGGDAVDGLSVVGVGWQAVAKWVAK